VRLEALTAAHAFRSSYRTARAPSGELARSNGAMPSSSRLGIAIQSDASSPSSLCASAWTLSTLSRRSTTIPPTLFLSTSVTVPLLRYPQLVTHSRCRFRYRFLGALSKPFNFVTDR
jgi:hypothetical protein